MIELKTPNKQMKLLRKMLDADGIPWHDDSDFMFCRTHSDEVRTVTRGGKKEQRRLFSVICGDCAYGGAEGLECWTCDMEDPEGHHSATTAMAAIREVL